MSHPTFARVAAAVASALLLAAGAQAAPRYHLVDLGSGSAANAINAGGDIAGTFTENGLRGCPGVYRDDAWHRVRGNCGRAEPVAINGAGALAGSRRLDGGHLHDLAVAWDAKGGNQTLLPDVAESQGLVIANDGTVLGIARPEGVTAWVFAWKAGFLSSLGGLAGSVATLPAAINGAGTIVGSATFELGAFAPPQPVMYANGAWTSLGSLGGGTGAARAINALGHVVGYSTVEGSDAGHGFFWSQGVMTDVGSLGGGYAWVDAINGHDDFVGYSADSALAPHAFVDIGSTMMALDTLVDSTAGISLIEAYGINDAGRIVGTGVGSDGQLHGWLAVPLP